MHSYTEILGPESTGPLHQPASLHNQRFFFLRSDGLRHLCNADTSHLATTYDDEAKTRADSCIPHRRLVSVIVITIYELYTNHSHNVCLTGIVRIIDTIRIDPEDMTYTNTGPALWNIVESNIGFVAANIPLMGPLLGKLYSRVKSLPRSYPTEEIDSGNPASATSKVLTRHGFSKGFERMQDREDIGVRSAIEREVTCPEIAHTESIPMNEIVVETNFELNYENARSTTSSD